MGKHFGNLQKLKGVTYYTLSPMEINPLMMMSSGIINFIRKCQRAAVLGAMPISLGSYIYYWGMKTYHDTQRKNPDDYKDEV